MRSWGIKRTPRLVGKIKYNVTCERSNEEYRDKGMHWAARLIALSLPIGVSLPASANTLTGKVVKITDGDTLYVLDANYQEHKIRLAGIHHSKFRHRGSRVAVPRRSPRTC